MGRIGKISVIPKDFSASFATMETSLRLRGFSRAPGTGVLLFPAKATSGKYVTGLDENSGKILDLIKKNPEEGLRKQKEIKELREQLQTRLGMDLGPHSDYFNFASKDDRKVQGFKLVDGDNLFDIDYEKNPWQALTFAWISNHPVIASSLEAYERGEYPADTQFYVNDEDISVEIAYRKHRLVDDAIIKFNSLTVPHRMKIVRCMGLPITDDVSETVVYNHFKEALSKNEMNVGPYIGKTPIMVFNMFANLDKNDLKIRDLIEQSLLGQIYREGKAKKIYEGESVVFESKEDMIDFFSTSKNQSDLLELESKVNLKKMKNA